MNSQEADPHVVENNLNEANKTLSPLHTSPQPDLDSSLVKCTLSELSYCYCVEELKKRLLNSKVGRRKLSSSVKEIVDSETQRADMLSQLSTKQLLLNRRPTLIDNLILRNKSALLHTQMAGKRGPKPSIRPPLSAKNQTKTSVQTGKVKKNVQGTKKEDLVPNKRKRQDEGNGSLPALKRVRKSLREESELSDGSCSSGSRNASGDRATKKTLDSNDKTKKKENKKILKKTNNNFFRCSTRLGSALRSGKKRRAADLASCPLVIRRNSLVKPQCGNKLNFEAKDIKKPSTDDSESKSGKINIMDSNSNLFVGSADSVKRELSVLNSSGARESVQVKTSPGKKKDKIKKQESPAKRIKPASVKKSKRLMNQNGNAAESDTSLDSDLVQTTPPKTRRKRKKRDSMWVKKVKRKIDAKGKPDNQKLVLKKGNSVSKSDNETENTMTNENSNCSTLEEVSVTVDSPESLEPPNLDWVPSPPHLKEPDNTTEQDEVCSTESDQGMPQLEVEAVEIEPGKERMCANNELPSQLENYHITNRFQDCAESSQTDDCNNMSIIESEDVRSVCSSDTIDIVASQSEILVTSSDNQTIDFAVPLGDKSNDVDTNLSSFAADGISEPVRSDSPNFEFSLDDSINMEDDLSEDNIHDEESVSEQSYQIETSEQQTYEICDLQSGIEILEEPCETVAPQDPSEIVTHEEPIEIENPDEPSEVDTPGEPSDVETPGNEPSEVGTPDEPSEVEPPDEQPSEVQILHKLSDIEILDKLSEEVLSKEYSAIEKTDKLVEVEILDEPSEVETTYEPSEVETPYQTSEVETPYESSEVETPDEPSEIETPVEPSDIGIHEELCEIERNEEICEIETHEDIFEVETFEESCKVEICENSSKVEICENSSKVEICENSSKVEICENSSNVEMCEDSSKVEICENSSKVEICENSSKVEMCEDSSKVGICENSSKVEMCENSGNVEMCEDSCKVEMYEEPCKVVDACQETCEELPKVSVSSKTEICEELSKVEAGGEEYKVEICEETCKIETCKVEGVNETIQATLGGTHLEIEPEAKQGKEVEEIQTDTIEVTPDADSTSDISRPMQEGGDNLFCDISLYLPEEEYTQLKVNDSVKEFSPTTTTSDVLPDSTQSKEIKVEENEPSLEDQEQIDESAGKEVMSRLNEETGEMEASQGEVEKCVSVEEPDAEKEEVNLNLVGEIDSEKRSSEVVSPGVENNESVDEVCTSKDVVKLEQLLEDSVETLKGEEEPVERLAMKEAVLQALGLKSLSAPVEKPKRPLDSGYTGTLKAVIKLNRGAGDKKSRTMVYRRSDDRIPTDILEYRICTEPAPSTEGVPITHLSDIAGHRKSVLKASHTDFDTASNSPNLNGAPAPQAESADGSGKESSLVIPEKSSSFSIHPGRLCLDVCSYCGGKFGSLDTPCHVAQLKGEQRQRKILDNEPNLTPESCLCDACYRHVDRKANCPNAGRSKARPKPPASSICCVTNCAELATHTVKRKWLLKLKKSITNKLDIDMERPGGMYYPLCTQHHYWVDYFTVCGICRKRLNRNHLYSLGAETDRLNLMLAEDGIPARLSDKLFLCKLCRYYSNLRLKYSDPLTIPPSNRPFYKEHRKKILKSFDIAVSESGDEAGGQEEESVGREEKRKGGGTAKKGEEGEGGKVGEGGLEDEMALRGLATLLGDQPEQQTRIQVKFGNVNIGTLSNLNIGQGRGERNLPGETTLPLSAQLDFQGPSTPDGSWERCVSTIQFDKRTKKLWQELQRPYGNQSSFLRHLVMLEKYWRSGFLVLSETVDPKAAKYINGVKNRLKAFEGVGEEGGGKKNGAGYSSLLTKTGEIEVTPILAKLGPQVTVTKPAATAPPPPPPPPAPAPSPAPVVVKRELVEGAVIQMGVKQAKLSYQAALNRAKSLVRMAYPPSAHPTHHPHPPPPPALLKIPPRQHYYAPHPHYSLPPGRPPRAHYPHLKPILPKLPRALTVTQLPPASITLQHSGITIEKQSGSGPPPLSVLPPEKPSISVFREPLPSE